MSEKSELIGKEILEQLKSELPIFRDPKDVRSIRQKDFVILICAAGLVILSILSGALYLRRPTVNTIVKTSDGQRVVSINDRQFGCGEPVELGKDNLSNDDKTYLVNQFSKWILGVYLPSRATDVENALNLIEDKNFLKEYSNQLVGGQLQREKREQWNAVWNPQKIVVDKNNPMLVRVIGTQELTRVENDSTKKEKNQYELTFELTTDSKRDDDDLRTGFKILKFNAEKLSS